MRRKELLRRIREEAKRCKKEVTEREGGSHTKLTVGSTSVRIPRHVQLNIETARGIMRDLDEEFGKGWSKL
jgi:mRNA interferase HicA